jgi:hypothetical protein
MLDCTATQRVRHESPTNNAEVVALGALVLAWLGPTHPAAQLPHDHAFCHP